MSAGSPGGLTPGRLITSVLLVSIDGVVWGSCRTFGHPRQAGRSMTLAPAGAVGCELAMSVTTAYMLVLMW
ncbi:MAG: hypothetical protein ABI251_04245 [Mycobacteriaceae bacterium]